MDDSLPASGFGLMSGCFGFCFDCFKLTGDGDNGVVQGVFNWRP